MKRTILFIILLVLISTLIGAVSVTLPQLIWGSTNIKESATISGITTNGIGNLTDNNYTTFASGVNATFYLNITEANESTSASKIQVTYNDTSTTKVNYTLSDYLGCYNAYDKYIVLKLTSNGTINITNNIYNETIRLLKSVGVPLTYPHVISATIFNQSSGSAISTTNYSIDYLTGNISLTEIIYNNTLWGVNYTYYTDSIKQNDRFCYNGSSWIELGTPGYGTDIYDIRMFWNIPSRSFIFNFTNLNPQTYSNQNTTDILVNITTINANATNNQTSWNCSLYTKTSRTANYTLNGNATSVPVINGSYFNQSINFNNGDRVWWYWSCEDEYDRQIANSSVRIFDVDVYYKDIHIFANLNLTNYNLYVGGCIKYNCSQPTSCITLGTCI